MKSNLSTLPFLFFLTLFTTNYSFSQARELLRAQKKMDSLIMIENLPLEVDIPLLGKKFRPRIGASIKYKQNLLGGNRHWKTRIFVQLLAGDYRFPVEYIEIDNPWLGVSRVTQWENAELPDKEYYKDSKNSVNNNSHQPFKFRAEHQVTFIYKGEGCDDTAFYCTRIKIKPIDGDEIVFFLTDFYRLAICDNLHFDYDDIPCKFKE